MATADKIKQTAKEEVERVKGLTHDAVRSSAYLYPLKGMLYFASHRSLWKPLGAQILPAMGTGVAILASMFFFTYLPQAAIMTLFNGPIAGLTTILLVLSESSALFMFVCKSLLVQEALIDTFDGTLLEKGQQTLVASDRQIKSGRDPIAKLGKLVTKPFARFAPSAMIRYLMYLPLNFIPVVGTVLFVLLQGKRMGPVAHDRYFQLKGFNQARREEFVETRKGAYTGFGTVAVLLEMIPIAGIFFAFTNQVAAALWAADMEKGETSKPSLSDADIKAK